MFQLQKYNTSVKQELLAGITTFLHLRIFLSSIRKYYLMQVYHLIKRLRQLLLRQLLGRYVWRF